MTIFLQAFNPYEDKEGVITYSLSAKPDSEFRVPLFHLQTDFLNNWVIAVYNVSSGSIGVANPSAPSGVVEYLRDFLNIRLADSWFAETMVQDDSGEWKQISGYVNILGHFFTYGKFPRANNDLFETIIPFTHHKLVSVNGYKVNESNLIYALMSPTGQSKPVTKHVWENWNVGYRFAQNIMPGLVDELFPGVRPEELKAVGRLQASYDDIEPTDGILDVI